MRGRTAQRSQGREIDTCEARGNSEASPYLVFGRTHLLTLGAIARSLGVCSLQRRAGETDDL